MSLNTAVVLDTDSGPRDELRSRLSQSGVLSICFKDEWICLENIHHIRPGVALLRTDSYGHAFRFINGTRAIEKSIPIIVLSQSERVKTLIGNNWLSNLHFLPYPLEKGRLRWTLDSLARDGHASHHPVLVAASPERQTVMRRLPRLGRAGEPILIQGAAGVGKKGIARAIVEYSISSGAATDFVDAQVLSGRWIRSIGRCRRRPHPKVEPPAVRVIENIDRLAPALQSQLLFLMEGGRGNGTAPLPDGSTAPFITLSGQILGARVNGGQFRTDLFHRLSVFPITVPRLCRRVDDIHAMAQFYAVRYGIRRNGTIYRLSKAVLEAMAAYHWPGNITELKRFIRQLVSSNTGRRASDRDIVATPGNRTATPAYIDPDELRAFIAQRSDISLKTAKQRYAAKVEKKLVKAALQQTRGNCKRAAGLLNISYKTMLTKAKAYHLMSTRTFSK